MEPIDNGWLCELKKYFLSIEELTDNVLIRIKRDRIRNNLPFDDSFKVYFLDRTNSRIACAYANFLYEERLEDEPILSNQTANHGSDGNGHARIERQLTSTSISPESIEQLPIILVQANNQHLASNTITTSRTFIQDGNQMPPEQEIISVPSNQLPSASSEVEIPNQDPEQELNVHVQRAERVVVKEEPRQEIEVVAEPTTESNPNIETENVRSVASGMATASTSTSTGLNGPKCTESYERTVNSNGQHPETIDLTSDQEDTVNCVGIDNDGPRNVENVAGSSQSMNQPRKWNNRNAVTGGILKKKPNSAIAVDTRKRHECDYCKYSTTRRLDLKNHIRTHTGERPYECVICKKRFTQKETINRHMRTHRDMFAFRCSNCRQGFSDETQRKVHESHCKAKGYECHLCKEDFIRKHQLVDHMRTHSGEKLQCPNCRKQFNSNQGLTYHMRTHGNMFPFQCSKCRQGFSDETLWNLHESRCKSKKFECYLCGKKFHHRKSYLLRHMRFKHTGEKPFGCSDCAKRFSSKSHLTRHSKRCN